MNPAYAYTPAIWPPLIAAALMIAGCVYCWRYREMPGARALIANMLVGVGFGCVSALEAAAVAPAAALFWNALATGSLGFGALTMTCFVLEYTYPGRWVTSRNVALLSLPPLFFLVAILIRVLPLVWTGARAEAVGAVQAERTLVDQWIDIYAALLSVVNLVAFVWLFLRSPQHRWPVALMVIPLMVVRIPFLLGLAGLPLPASLDLVSIGRVLGVVSYSAAILSFRIFDPVPLARQAVLEQMDAGALVFDPRWRILSLNPAAEAILSVRVEDARGKTWREVVREEGPSLPAPSERVSELSDISIGSGPNARLCAPAVSELTDFRGLLLGHLLLLRDVTGQRRAQAALLEQRWAQATLQERAQLAHELHDGLTQSLAFLNVQAQAAELYEETGQDDEARAAVRRLAEVSREMQDEVRELIGNLLEVTLPSEGFAGTLRHIVVHYQERNGIPVSLDIDDPGGRLVDGGQLPAATGVQLVRIVQEALANARKHAAADLISVQVRAMDGRLQLAVEDNGVGFFATGARQDGPRFGLQVMQERAEKIGGRLAVHSAPGRGTRVEVCAPLRDGSAEARA